VTEVEQAIRIRTDEQAEKRFLEAETKANATTPNVERRISNEAVFMKKRKSKRSTPNAQRRTSNIDRNGRGYTTQGVVQIESTSIAVSMTLRTGCWSSQRKIVRLAELLPQYEGWKSYCGQLLRCGTSPLSNHGEVEAAEFAKGFFFTKTALCLKEFCARPNDGLRSGRFD